MSRHLTVYDPPGGEAHVLQVRPRLESWDAADHPSQLALTSFLDHLVEAVTADTSAIPSPWCAKLHVGLPSGTSLTSGGNDLDNYAFPIARRLGHQELAAVHAEKSSADVSTFALGSARPATGSMEAWSFASAATTASAQSRQWKEQVAAAVSQQVAAPAAPGPLEVHVAFGVSQQRNWTTLWKPAIDALGAILGHPPGRPFAPFDDRVVRLGLHRTIDDALGWTVRIGIWWRNTPNDEVR